MEDKPKSRVSGAKDYAAEQITTLFVLFYIINGVVIFLILFGWISPSDFVSKIVGAVALAYSIVGLLAYIQMGVKHQSNSKKKGRK